MAEEVPLLVVGVDHHRTPLADRERLAVAGDALSTLEDALAALPGVATITDSPRGCPA